MAGFHGSRVQNVADVSRCFSHIGAIISFYGDWETEILHGVKMLWMSWLEDQSSRLGSRGST
jgi:hypothetical protein